MKVGLTDMTHAMEHPAPAGHPENAERMVRALEYVRSSDIASELELFTLPPADEENISLVHDSDYLDYAKDVSLGGGGYLDGDTYMSPGSYKAATLTALTAVSAADAIMNDKYKAVFFAGRPPGHHAERNCGMGFCIINNIAVAAEYLIVNRDLKRVAIIDWDVHHGNGTQHIFYDRSDVFYISLHHYPFYPGTGAKNEIGIGDGEGYTLNIPLPAGTGDDIYLENFSEKIIPALEKYKPQFILISCGFDAHCDDLLGGMGVNEETYGEMTRMLMDIAGRYSEGRILSLFEGGYDPEANGRCLYYHMKELQKSYE